MELCEFFNISLKPKIVKKAQTRILLCDEQFNPYSIDPLYLITHNKAMRALIIYNEVIMLLKEVP